METRLDTIKWFLTEVLAAYDESHDRSLIRDMLSVVEDEFGREIVLKALFGTALDKCDWELADLCIENGIRLFPQPSDSEDSGPIHVAMANSGNRPDIVKWLIDKGVDVERRGINNLTPLMYAAKQGWPETVHVLLAHGADANASTVIDNDWTSLMFAAENGSENVAAMLLEAGADPSRKDRWGADAENLARKSSNWSVARAIQEWQKR